MHNSRPADIGSEADTDLLQSRAVRSGCRAVFSHVSRGNGLFFIHEDRLDACAKLVANVTRRNYPDLKVPVHGRMRHFDAGLPRMAAFRKELGSLEPIERARMLVDLVVPSVLLDAGAGALWKYTEANTGRVSSRSEGLAIASYHLFRSGALASDGKSPRADAEGLARVTASVVADAFQVSSVNPIIGLEGRASLVSKLGDAVRSSPIFAARASGAKEPVGENRVGHLVDHLVLRARGGGGSIRLTDVLSAVLDGLGSIWPGRITRNGRNLGDTWNYEPLTLLVPFHKLSQWLSYSLMEPLEEAGLRIDGENELTGLPEYRNGGLLLDTGVLTLRDPSLALREHTVDSTLVVEWRALTVTLLDILFPKIRSELGADLPIPSLLEGGTWAAGRVIANEMRTGGGPPLKIVSDGTVF